ncbi:MAG: thioredoxin domain-containing protein [Magnetococcales bacterium]|nr:thioredoxin domain-containing protein [Magnetococcales bacterium]MBF0156015.1 thioredoxin domain-containing protein [Magnetococcales bacterium]
MMRSKRYLMLAVGAWLALSVAAPLQAGTLAAKVGGKQITVEEVDKALGMKRYEVDRQLYQLRHDQARDLVADHLLELEAKSLGMTADAYLEQEIARTAKPVESSEVDQFLKANAQKFPNVDDELRAKVGKFLKLQGERAAWGKVIGRLEQKYNAEILLTAPEPPRVEVKGAMTPVKGGAQAAVTVVEFSDFECPYCSRVQDVLGQLLAHYGDRIRIVFRHFPMPFHANAAKASEAGQCAEEQGKFWPFHDAMFKQQNKLTVPDLKALAKATGLDAAKFDACLDGGTQAARVKADREEGERLGVSGTPTFFVNGISMVGSLPLEEFKTAIDAELAAAKAAAPGK